MSVSPTSQVAAAAPSGRSAPGAGIDAQRRKTMRLAVIILNYRTAPLVMDCLASLSSELTPGLDEAIVVDNASGDGSAETIERAILERGWSAWARVARSDVNGGFAAGNNVGLREADAESVLLLNSDTIVRPGALAALRRVLEEDRRVGVVGPRLEWPDGARQNSAFRFRTPLTEFMDAAATGPISRAMKRFDTSIDPDSPQALRPDWTTFACAMIRRETLEAVGSLDEGYFMYCEDMDYCRRARNAGWEVAHCPEGRVVHLRGGTSSVKRDSAAGRRRPRYYYESRARWYAGRGGAAWLWAANAMWSLGWMVSLAHRVLRGRRGHIVEGEARDIWTNALRPMRKSAFGARGGVA